MSSKGNGIFTLPPLALAVLFSTLPLFLFSACPFGARIQVLEPLPLVVLPTIYTVTYDLNGGNGTTPAAQQCEAGNSVITASRAGLSKEGYTFKGWNTNSSGGTETRYQTGQPYTPPGDITLYAEWEELPPQSLVITVIRPGSTLTPIAAETLGYSERNTAFTVRISGFTNDADANDVGVSIAEVTGLSFSGHEATGSAASNGVKTFTVSVTYNGVQAFPSKTAPIYIMGVSNIPSDYTYPEEMIEESVDIIDGQAEERAIPVNQTNIRPFNIYAGTASGLRQHYQLIEDIVLTADNWTSIGDYNFESPRIFTGSFDGQGHTINNLTVNTPDAATTTAGMFGSIGYIGVYSTKGVVKNLGLTDGTVKNGGRNTGGVVGWNRGGTVENCYFTGIITGSASGDSRAGGVVGNNNAGGIVKNCYSTSTVSGSQYVGGVVGANSGGTVENCYAIGNVTGNDFTGGVIGGNINGTVRNCYATGNVVGNDKVGGVAGDIDSNSTMQNCYAAGIITGSRNQITSGADADKNHVGGVVGRNMNTVRNCVALNPSITLERPADALCGRVAGYSPTGLTNNFGREPMNTITTPNKTAAGKDGANITNANWNNTNWWQTTAQFPSEAWEFRAGLPTLKNMPGVAQNPTAP